MSRDTRSAYRARAAQADREIAEALQAERDAKDAAHRATKAARAEREANRVGFTRDDLLEAVVVKDTFGWHKVVRVNATTITVESGYSWNDYIEYDHVLDYRGATK